MYVSFFASFHRAPRCGCTLVVHRVQRRKSALTTFQAFRPADGDDFSALSLEHPRQRGAIEPVQRIGDSLDHLLHFGVVALHSRYEPVGGRDEYVHMAGLTDQVVGFRCDRQLTTIRKHLSAFFTGPSSHCC
jgi:hypothetical protein